MVYYWHIHHDVIVEPTDDIEERKEYVRKYKPVSEVETRLRLMTPVKAQDTVGKAWKEYDTTVRKARKEYRAIDGKAWKEYDAIDDKAHEEYAVIRVKAWIEYGAIGDKAHEEYESIREKAWKEYGVIGDKAYEEYEAIRDKAYEEYDATSDKALKEYNAKLESLHKKEHPDCPWNGKTIFPKKRTD